MTALAADARRIWHAAVGGVRADTLLARVDWDAALPRPLDAYRRVVVVGAGKAAMAMAGAVERRIAPQLAPDAVLEGAVVVPHGYPAAFPAHAPRPAHVHVREAGHPVPDAAGVAAAEEALALCTAAGRDTLVLALVSGGGSALWPAAAGVTLDDVRATVNLLLRSGADIAAVNAVRRHLARVAGGRLAAAARPADVLALVLSDVPGDDPAVVASGPTTPDPTTYTDAAAVLWAHGLWDQVPETVRARLTAGMRGRLPDTVKPGDPALAGVRTVVIGTNADALAAARREAAALGYEPRVLARALAGEARDVGAAAARAALEAAAAPAGAPVVCLLWGGEPTVTVRGAGRGGRSQECALAAALTFEHLAAAGTSGADVVYLAGGTDGIDGPTRAAGAWVTPATARRARARGVDPAAALDANDAHGFFATLGALDGGGLLVTGPTHTNAMDVHVALVRRGDRP